MSPSGFTEPYGRVVRPLLERAERCPIFFDVERVRLPHPGVAAKWRQAGATPETWLTGYIHEVEGFQEVRLTRETLDDELFWWWAICGVAGTRLALWTPLSNFDVAEFFSRTFAPEQYGGDVDRTGIPVRRFAKRLTARNDSVAFIPDHNLIFSVIASAANCERLFREAVEHASLPPYD